MRSPLGSAAGCLIAMCAVIPANAAPTIGPGATPTSGPEATSGAGVTPITGPAPASGPVAVGRQYYIALNGSDSNPGTLERPFLHFRRFVEVARPGDTGYVRAGTYDDCLFGMHLRGTPTAPITFRSFPGERVVIDRRDAPHGPGAGQTLYQYGILVGHGSGYNLGGHVIIDGFVIQHVKHGDGIVVHHAPNVIVRNCEVSGCRTGIVAIGACQDVVFEDNYVHHCTNEGLAATDEGGRVPGEPRNIIVRRNYAAYMSGDLGKTPTTDGPALQGHCIHFAGVLGGEIAWNIAHDSMEDIIDANGAAEMPDKHRGTLNVVFHHNIAFNANPNNEVTGNGNGIKVSTKGGGGHTVYANICFANQRGGFDQDITPSAPGNFFYNNTAYANGGYGLILEGGQAGPHVASVAFNNILAGHTNHDYRITGLHPIKESDYNLIADGQVPKPEGPHSIVADPKFVDPYAHDPATHVIRNSQGPLDTAWQGLLAATMTHIRRQVEAAFALREGSPCLRAGRPIPGITDPAVPAPDLGAVPSPSTRPAGVVETR